MNTRKFIPVSLLLSNASRELRLLNNLVKRFEEATSDLLTRTEGQCADQIHDLQELDRMVQTFNNLADFLNGLAADLPPWLEVPTDGAMKRMNIEALAQRLLTVHDEVTFEEDIKSGECSLF